MARTPSALLAALTLAAAGAPRADADRIVVEGQALNALGGGVLGAEVRVQTVPQAGKKPKVLASGQTDQAGDFKLELPQGTRGKIVVCVRAEGFKEFRQTVDLAEDDEPYVVAEVGGSLSLSGRVTRAASTQPISGATVTYNAGAGRRKVTTDQDGHYKIDGLQPGRGRLEVVAERCARERVDVALFEGQTLDVELRPEYQVEVVVVDDRNKPAPGVTVEAISDDPPQTYSAITDRTGRVRLRGVHPDATKLEVRLLTEVHITPSLWDRAIPLPDGQEKVTRRFVLPRPATLAGQVVRARDKKPVSLARVSIGPDKGALITSSHTDGRGRFKIVGLPAEKVVVTAQHAEYAPDLKGVQLEPNRTVRVKLMLGPGAPVTGVVKDDTGRPVGEALVLANGWRGYDTVALHAETDPNGRFIIEHVPADGVMFTVTANGFDPLINALLKPGRKKHELIVYARGGSPVGLGAGANVGADQMASFRRAKSLDGQPLEAGRLQGKFVLLDFWATWCPPCRTEVPHLKAAAKALARRKDFIIIGVSLDESQQALREFIKANQITWPQLFGEAGRVREIAAAFGVNAIPATFLLAPGGEVIAKDLRGPGLTQAIKQHLKRPPASKPTLNRPSF
jgi:thiol-disulfide isomerase/thioredoxin